MGAEAGGGGASSLSSSRRLLAQRGGDGRCNRCLSCFRPTAAAKLRLRMHVSHPRGLLVFQITDAHATWNVVIGLLQWKRI
jgi:hypothetical protein